MIRALTIVGDLGAGGTQRAAQNFAIGYARAGCESAILAINSGGSRVEELSSTKIKMFIAGSSEEERKGALDEARKWGPSLLHIHRHGLCDPVTGSVMKEFKQLGRPILETNVFARVDYSSDRRLIDAHLHLSHWSLWKWKQWSQIVNPQPIGVFLPYMVDSQAFYPASLNECANFRKKQGIPNDAFVFGRVGQPFLGKWSPIIFDAFQKVANNYKNIYLLLVGLPDQLRTKIKSLPINVQQRIIEIPFIYGDENLRACYTAMNTFLHASSIGESFGMVLAESMLCGCPVITLSTPAKDNSQLEVVGHNRGGLVVTDKQSMVEAMLRLYEDELLRKRLARQGSDWVRTHYDVSKVIPTLMKIANLTLTKRNQKELSTAMQRDPELITHVSQSEIVSLLSNTLGKTQIKERILMKIVHNPRIYRCYIRMKIGSLAVSGM